MLVTTNYTQAMAFDVNGNPTATEVQLQLSRHQGSDTGNVLMQLCSDLDGAPNNTPITEVSRDVNELLVSYPTWFLFEIPNGVPLTQGTWWIVCKVTDAETTVSWHVANGDNYGTADDTRTSTDNGNTWPTIKLLDAGFRVFGTRTAESTTTTITADPNIVQNGNTLINVSVRDSMNNPVRGPGQVLLIASDGLFTDSNSTDITLTLEDANASTIWSAPDSVTSVDINAFYQGHNYSGIDYNDSNTAATIAVLAQDRTTTTFLDITSSHTIFVEQVVDMNVTVRDSNNNLVSGGKVVFSCTPKSGKFAADSVDVSTGKNSNTWTASLTTGNFTIEASYVGGSNAGGTIIYGPSDFNDTVTVEYNDVDTETTVRVSPGAPYAGLSTFVIVEVRDEFGNLVPGGTVEVNTIPSYGTFRCPNSVMELEGGIGYTEWSLPAYKPASTITVGADYEWLTPGYTAAGKRYLGSQGIKSGIKIVQDSDSTGSSLNWMTEWITNYTWPTDDLSNTDDDANGFAKTLKGWTGQEFSNKNAWEDHMKGNIFGQEDSFMDVADFTYFSGHGAAKYVLFSSWQDNTRLNRNDCYNDWGDKDAEWVALSACFTMGDSRNWAKTMDGLHGICGFVTEMGDSAKHGRIFGSFLRQQHVYDRPHPVVQSWFLAGDQSQKIGRRQRAIGEVPEFEDQCIWGQGYVGTDPPNDDTHYGICHDFNQPASPIANAGGPYLDAVAGQLYQLDGSGTSALTKEHHYSMVWDLDTSTNSDSNDWDNDSFNGWNDDADAWGRRPQWVFPTAKTYGIRLMVIDDDWEVASDTASVVVSAPLTAAESQPDEPVIQLDSNDGLDIVNNFDPNTLPTEATMQGFSLSGYSGHHEMVSIMQSFGLEVGEDIFAAGQDELGNYTTTYEDKEWIVNKHTGALMYLDASKAYVSPNDLSPPPELPTEANAVIIADAFIAANAINKQGAIVDNVIAICAEESLKGSRTCTSRIPFQKCVNYRRMLQSYGQPYPVVGPGGKITVLMDPNGVVMFMKNCRQAEESGEIVLSCTPQQAVSKFHELGPKALIGSSIVPFGCNRIEINGVSLGYYEEDFATLQTSILPVYILDVTCEDPNGVYDTSLYMSAIAVPVEPNIIQPVADPLLPYGDPITFTGSAQGGTSPYSYEWRSDVDGLLSTEPNFTTSSLSINYQNDAVTCELLPHTISLTVTDSNGFEATEYIEVTVEGLCADFDHTNTVNFEDFAQFAPCWLAQLGQDNYDKKKDFNRDSTIDAKDLCVVTDEWLQ